MEKYGSVALSENPPVPRGVANYGHEFYTRLFELILRLKGNYLWPAMWNNAFNENAAPQMITLVPEDYNARNGNSDWEKSVSDNARFSHSTHTLSTPGYHTLKIFMVDPGVVLQKIIVTSGGLKPSYLGPPESFHKPVNLNK